MVWKHKKKKVGVLVIAMLFLVLATALVYAGVNKWIGLAQGDILIKDTITRISEGVTEHEVVTNNAEGNDQKIDYLCEINPSDTVKVVAGYGQDNADSWSLTPTTKQAVAYEKNHPGTTVVAGINADFFNMGTGEPMGALVMEGKEKHAANGRYYFGVTKQGQAVIRNDSDMSDLETAVGGDALLINDGKIMSENTAYGSMDYSRTAIGIKPDGTIVTFVTYGNRAPVSCGRTYMEIAEMLKEAGCTYALALDGGGSSTFVARPEGTTGLQVRNHPVDGAERAVSSSLLVVTKGEKTGEFSHAQLTPNNEVYTPKSKVQFEAKGVDTAGFAMDLPEGTTWSLAADSNDLGTIDAGGVFKANDKTGVVTVNLMKDGAAIGETSIEIVKPDKIYFATEEVSLGFEDESDLGLVVRSKGRDVNYKDGDIKWNFKYNDEYLEKGPGAKATTTIGDLRIDAKNGGTYGNLVSVKISDNAGKADIRVYVDGEEKEVFPGLSTVTEILKLKSAYVNFYRVGTGDSITRQEETKLTGGKEPTLADLGKFENNIFTSYNSTAKGVVTATSAYDDSVKGNINLIVGMLPTVVWDFEDHENEDDSKTDAATYYIGTQEAPGILTHSNYKRGGNESIEIVDRDDDEPVRFGQKSLKLNYDFTQCGAAVTEGACIGTTSGMTIPGVPTGIGVWVYAPEGVGIEWEGQGSQAGFWLRGYVKDGTGANVPYDFTLEPKVIEEGSNQQPGIYWEGWKYLEADLTKLQAPYSIQPGMTFRLMYVGGTKMGTKTANSVYFDNLQFVYGTNVDDIDNPIIDSITVNGKELKENDTIETNVLKIDSIFHDVENKYTSGVNDSDVRMYIDGVNVVADKARYVYECKDSIAHLYNLKLKDGPHSVTVTVRDGFGNETSETRNFTVDTSESVGDTIVKVVPDGDAILGGVAKLQIIASDANVAENTTVFKLGSQYKNYDVQFSENYTGKVSYSKLTKSITVKATRNENAKADDGNVIATLAVKIPSDLLEGDNFTYTVKSGKYETENGGYGTYSTSERSMPVKATYDVSCEPIVIGGANGIIKVVNAEGKPAANVSVYLTSDNSLVGKTDENGQIVTDKFNTEAAEYSVYAKDENGLLSFRYKVYSFNPQGDADGLPYNVRFNAVDDSTTQKNITWFSNPLVAEAQNLKYREDGSESWTTVTANSKQTQFGTNGYDSVNINSVSISELKPGVTYQYIIGNDKKTTEVKTFTTDTVGRSDSKFFILGDIQDPDKSNLKGIVEKLSKDNYNLGVQIGDAIDQASDYTDWSDLGEIVGANMLGSIDMINVMGNHEYYGDSDASIASAIYNNPTTEAGTCYSKQYGNVYFAVINFGENTDQIKAAAEWLKNDAAKSKATWKVLVSHQPPYYTNSVGGNAPVNQYLPAACEKAGIDVVFSGHDHSFARTNPLTDGKVDEDNGTVYYISGAIGSKRYPVSTKDKFDYNTIFNYMSEGFTASYLTVDSDKEKMTINMYEYGNESPVNTCVIQSECKKNGHKLVYDPASKTAECTVCGDTINNFTGEIKDAKGNEYYLLNGEMQTGWTTVGEDMRYYGANGIREELTVDEHKSTCIIDGYVIYTTESGESKRVDYNDAGGHEYEQQKDGSFVCSKCGWRQVEMKDLNVSLSYDKCTYTGKGKTPSTTAVNPLTGETLKKVNPYRDYYSKYENNVEVGTASVTLTAMKYGVYVNMKEWRGNYKGTVTLNYTVHPDVPKNAYVGYKGSEAKLIWDAAEAADKYVVQQYVSGAGWKTIITTDKTSYSVKNLKDGTSYRFRIGTVGTGKDKKGNNVPFNSLKYTLVETVKASDLMVTYSVNDGLPILKWNKYDGASYTVYRSTSLNGQYSEIATTDEGSFKDTSAKSGQTYYYQLKTSYNKGDGVLEADSSAVKAPVSTNVIRFGGSDRYETSTMSADALKEKMGVNQFDTIIVACGSDYPDALTGSYLAKVKKAPMLLVDKNSEGTVETYIRENLSDNGVVYILGGTGVVSQNFENSLSEFNVKRLAGGNRYDTNLAVLKEAGVNNSDILICTGEDFADSLSASAVGEPILLTAKTGLNKTQVNYLNSLDLKDVYLIGGEGVVSNSIAKSVAAFDDDGTADRLGGKDRYLTSVAVAEKFFANGSESVVLAYAQNFPDGLTAGPLAMSMEGPLVLVDNSRYTTAKTFVDKLGADKAIVLGGPTLITDKVANIIIN